MGNKDFRITKKGTLTKYEGTDSEVVIPDKVTKIAAEVFAHNHKTKKVTIPGSVEIIEHGAFFLASNLEQINISEGVTSIGRYAFSLTKLCEIVIPASVVSIETRAFTYDLDGESSVKKIVIYSKELALGGYVFPEDEGISFYAPNVSLSCFATSNKRQIVYTYLTENNEYSPERIEEYNQYINRNYEIFLLAIRNNDPEVLSKLLQIRKKMKPEKLDEMIELAGENVEIKTLLMNYKSKTIGTRGIGNIGSKLNNNPYTVTEMKKIWEYEQLEDSTILLLRYKAKDTEIVIPPCIGTQAVTVIGEFAFSKMKKKYTRRSKYSCALDQFSFIEIPENIIKIEKGAFAYCDNLRKVVIHNGVKSIASDAFCFCNRLSDIEIPKSVSRIGKDAFYNCNLVKIHAPAGSYAEQYAKKNNIPFVAE